AAIGLSAASLLIAELERRLDAFELRGRADQRSHRRGRPSLAADHSTDVARRHEQLDERLAAMLALRHPDRVRMIRERPRDNLDDVPRAAHDAGCSAAGSGRTGIRAPRVATGA